MDVFERCKQINNLLNQNKEQEARDALICLLQELKNKEIAYTPLINHLIRETGLYPYIDEETSDWRERFVVEAFKVNAGANQQITLHREQSGVLKSLLDGEDLAISAPTSFGKSFIIDAFLDIKKPNTVVVIVPTIALSDEVRRRLYPKFSSVYKIITTTGVKLGERNLFIFPQERALQYVEEIEHIDLLIVDEFYKAGKIQGSNNASDGRAALLIEAIFQLSKKSAQRYFLAPNISELKNSAFTKGLRFKKIDFNTVYTKISKLYEGISGNKREKEAQKFKCLREILESTKEKSIIYVNSHANIVKVSEGLSGFCTDINNILLNQFSLWIREHYGENYILVNLVKKGIGIHSGLLHRSLAQIQIKLFEQEGGLRNLVSTSSLIEGVNTSARNVIVWSNKNSKSKFDYFTYKNIAGRSGRMFRHFIGEVYLLESPPKEIPPLLELDYPDSLLERIDPEEYLGELSSEQIAKIKDNEAEMDLLLGKGGYRQVITETASQGVSKSILIEIIESINSSPPKWNKKLQCLLNTDPERWGESLFLILSFLKNIKHFKEDKTTIVHFIQTLSNNWTKTIPDMLKLLRMDDIAIEDYFRLEKLISFDFVSLLNSINAVAKRIPSVDIDISPFIAKVSNAFLPSLVFELEEYGLPRMLSRKIQSSQVIDLEKEGVSINEILDEFRNVGKDRIIEVVQLSEMDRFILSHFFDGITPIPSSAP